MLLWTDLWFEMRCVVAREPLGNDALTRAPWLLANMEVTNRPRGTGKPAGSAQCKTGLRWSEGLPSDRLPRAQRPAGPNTGRNNGQTKSEYRTRYRFAPTTRSEMRLAARHNAKRRWKTLRPARHPLSQHGSLFSLADSFYDCSLAVPGVFLSLRAELPSENNLCSGGPVRIGERGLE